MHPLSFFWFFFWCYILVCAAFAFVASSTLTELTFPTSCLLYLYIFFITRRIFTGNFFFLFFTVLLFSVISTFHSLSVLPLSYPLQSHLCKSCYLLSPRWYSVCSLWLIHPHICEPACESFLLLFQDFPLFLISEFPLLFFFVSYSYQSLLQDFLFLLCFSFLFLFFKCFYLSVDISHQLLDLSCHSLS